MLEIIPNKLLNDWLRIVLCDFSYQPHKTIIVLSCMFMFSSLVKLDSKYFNSGDFALFAYRSKPPLSPTK